eukprot:1336929-Pleurochrysis_carterae.AAC.4
MLESSSSRSDSAARHGSRNGLAEESLPLRSGQGLWSNFIQNAKAFLILASDKPPGLPKYLRSPGSELEDARTDHCDRI